MAEQARNASPLSPGEVARLIWRSLDKKAQKEIVSKAKLNLVLKRDFYGEGR